MNQAFAALGLQRSCGQWGEADGRLCWERMALLARTRLGPTAQGLLSLAGGQMALSCQGTVGNPVTTLSLWSVHSKVRGKLSQMRRNLLSLAGSVLWCGVSLGAGQGSILRNRCILKLGQVHLSANSCTASILALVRV